MDPRFEKDVTRALLWGPRVIIAVLVLVIVLLVLSRKP